MQPLFHHCAARARRAGPTCSVRAARHLPWILMHCFATALSVSAHAGCYKAAALPAPSVAGTAAGLDNRGPKPATDCRMPGRQLHHRNLPLTAAKAWTASLVTARPQACRPGQHLVLGRSAALRPWPPGPSTLPKSRTAASLQAAMGSSCRQAHSKKNESSVTHERKYSDVPHPHLRALAVVFDTTIAVRYIH